MSALSIQPTYPIFTDIDGQPLEDGYVWIGTANLDPQTNPINVYWDAALTLPAAQPIRTLAGYPANSGTPARLYVNSDYSIRVMNKNGSMVYSAPEATERYSGAVISSISAANVSFQQPYTGSVLRTVQAKLENVYVNAADMGVQPSNSASDNLANLNAAIANVPDGTTIEFTEPGVYNISQYVSVLRSNIRLLAGPGVTINNTNVSAGYPSDGIRVGNMAAVEGEGGTNVAPYTYVENVIVDGFTFTNCRIGVWFVYCKNFVAQNIRANSTAAVACGNDAYDDCFDFEIKNITQISWSQRKGSEDFYIVGIYRCKWFKIDGVYQLGGMTFPANAASIDVNESEFFSVVNAHLDQQNTISNGISLNGCTYFNVDNCTVVRAKSGFVTFPRNGIQNMLGTITGVAVNCTNGIQAFASYTTFRDVYTKGCTYDLALQTDAALNVFDGCRFNIDGAASVYQEIPTGNNGINLQRWRNCNGIIMGTANGYFGGLSTSLRAVQSAGASNVTGNGANWTVVGWTEEFENNNGTNMFDPVTGVFTAPITGLYRVEAGITLDNAVGSGITFSQLILDISGGSPDVVLDRQYVAQNAILSGSTLVQINRGGTAKLELLATGAAGNTVGIPANPALNYLTIMLVA